MKNTPDLRKNQLMGITGMRKTFSNVVQLLNGGMRILGILLVNNARYRSGEPAKFILTWLR
ncbi:hypothetical protein CHH54_12685 [Bacillus sp. 7520-S]|nr:hypothetical protein CHH54_12685 [Bacillus sp. 7520-S]